jgi:hypothetical protein
MDMLTINTILKEIKDVPVERLDEVYEFVHSLTVKKEKAQKRSNALDALAGCMSDMSEQDYQDFVSHTQEVRNELFTRKFDI